MTSIGWLATGTTIGLVIGAMMGLINQYVYQRILYSKGHDRSTEFIMGEPFVIVPEHVYYEMRRHVGDAPSPRAIDEVSYGK